MFPDTEKGRREAWQREYLKQHGGLQAGTDAAKALLKQQDALRYVEAQMLGAGGKPHLPDAVKKYTRRLGIAGLDYRVIRLARTEQAAMLADEQTDIARNSFVSNGEMEFTLARGRDHWNCQCEIYAGQVYAVDDPERPVIPVHPNCVCEWRPKLKTDAEIIAEFYRGEEGVEEADFEAADIHQKTLTERFSDVGLNEADLSKLAPETREIVIEAVEKAYEKIPEVKGAVTSISIDKKNALSYDTLAGCYTYTGDIVLNNRYYKDIALLKEKYNKGLALGHFPKGTDYKSVVAHETGHAILNTLAKRLKEDYYDLASTIKQQVLQEQGLRHDDIPENLSKYGKSNPVEFIAEAVSEGVTSKAPRSIAKRVVEILKYLLGAF